MTKQEQCKVLTDFIKYCNENKFISNGESDYLLNNVESYVDWIEDDFEIDERIKSAHIHNVEEREIKHILNQTMDLTGHTILED